jgi:hypothetical protein
MEKHFVPECYFDTVLVKNILKVKNVNHQKNCFKVGATLEKIEDFAVGIIDKDKFEIEFVKVCRLEIETENLLLWKHPESPKFLIQIKPALERWILNVVDEAQIDVSDLGITMTLEGMTDFTRNRLVSENEDLKRLCKRLINSNSKTVGTLSSWLNYLFKENRNADINEMKQWV